ncbi:hypothetical protein BGW80DRAFT_1167183, partial [Lactifluus volemus]
NLTLSDWLTVLKYVNEHPGVSQGDIVYHFKSRIDGALLFLQSALSCTITERPDLIILRHTVNLILLQYP